MRRVAAAKSCLDEQQLRDFVTGVLPTGQLRPIEQHLEACGSCFDALALRASMLSGAKTAAVGGLPILAPGDLLVDRYRIEAHLGTGSSGQVFRSIDLVLSMPVAVKLLRPELASNPAWVARLSRELKLAREVHSPHVCRVFNLETPPGAPFLVMELGQGSLRAELERGERAATVAEQLAEARTICAGLAALHDGGVVHRDLKPDNILRMPDGRLAISDLGLATWAAGAAQTRFVGTPYYMAPEVMRGQIADVRSDVWSLGMVLREIVRAPGPATGPSLVGSGPRRPRWRDRLRLRAFQRLCARCLADRPSRRPRDGGQVLRELEAAARAGPLSLLRNRRGHFIWLSGLLALLALWSWERPGQRIRPARAAVSAGPAFVTGTRDHSSQCNCPFSSCTERCVSSCRATGYTVGQALPGLNVRGQQEALLGASVDGATILFVTGPRCASNRLTIARRQGATYVTADLTDDADLADLTFDETCCTLSADGRTLVLRSADRSRFLEALLVGADVRPPIAAPFANLTTGFRDGTTVHHPVLAADGRTLYFQVLVRGVGDGVFTSRRASIEAPFGPSARLPGDAQRYERVTGISEDGLTLFLTFNFETIVLSRPTVDHEFRSPRQGNAPPRLLGWRSVPIEGCGRILTTITPGGCESEDITWLEAVAP